MQRLALWLLLQPLALLPYRGRLQQQLPCRAVLLGQRQVLLQPVALLPCRERLLQQGQQSMSRQYPVQRLPLCLLLQQNQLHGRRGPQHLCLLQLLKRSLRLVLGMLPSQPSLLSQELQSGLTACLHLGRAPSRADWLEGRLGFAARVPLVAQVKMPLVALVRIPLVAQVPACRPPASCSQLVTAAHLWPSCQLCSRLMLRQEVSAVGPG